MRQKHDIEADIRTVAAYIGQSKASQPVQEAFDQICDASLHVKSSTTEHAIRQLQEALRKLSTQAEKSNPWPSAGETQASYASVAGRHAPQQSRLDMPFTKDVPARHKRETIVLRGEETTAQKSRLYKELIEQLNSTEIAGKAAVVRQLPSSDLIITIKDKQACNSWLTDIK